jgi:putative two-component system response regulator
MNFDKVYEHSKNLNILYVEDNAKLLEETYDILEDYFSHVQTAVNGKEALQQYQNYFNKYNKFYDLVITDINMPKMDGIALIKEIHKIYNEQNIIVISAYNESERLIDLIHIGITNFIMKPLASEQFTNLLYKTCKQVSNQIKLDEYHKSLENINTNLDKKVHLQEEEIFYTQQISIQAIANMIESYDDETGTHTKRIESYTSLISNEIPISDEYPETLKATVPFASLLHDIGKLMIPKQILIKPARLNDYEFNIIKTHAKLGGDVLKKANIDFKKHFDKDSYLKAASDIAMYHHEKWDGSGYPEGLVGNAIPKCARIVAIADVYDALRSKRVYKDAMSHNNAVEIIKNESEKSFDPELVSIFLNIHSKLEKAFTKLS